MENTKVKIEKIGLVPNKSVLKHTGKNWDSWIHILNKASATHLKHKEITVFLKTKYKLSTWWQHEVATGYEIHIGRKLPGRNAKGLFSTTTTKTFNCLQKYLWDLVCAKNGVDIWLKPIDTFSIKIKNHFEVEGGIYGEVRTIKKPSRIRLSWIDIEWSKPTFVQILIIAKPKNKCMLVIQHEGLETAAIKAKLKERWKSAVDDLVQFVDVNS